MLSVYPSEVQQHYQQTPPASLYYPPALRPMPHRQPEVPAGSVLVFASSSSSSMTSSPHHGHHLSHHSHHSHHPSKTAAAGHHQHQHQHQHHQHNQQDAAVAQALEIARESPDGASDPTVSKILEHALSQIWAHVQAQPESYIMSRDEFAVFNFFQHRFTGDKTAITARKRYWDHARA